MTEINRALVDQEDRAIVMDGVIDTDGLTATVRDGRIDPNESEDGVHLINGMFYAVLGGRVGDAHASRDGAEFELATFELDAVERPEPEDPMEMFRSMLQGKQSIKHVDPATLRDLAHRWHLLAYRDQPFERGDVLHQNEFGFLRAFKDPAALVVFLDYIPETRTFPDAEPHDVKYTMIVDCIIGFLDTDGDWCRLAVDSRHFDRHAGSDQ